LNNDTILTGQKTFTHNPTLSLDEISPADQKLCQLLRLDSDPQTSAEEICVICGVICGEEWPEIFRRAMQYQLDSVLYRRLKQAPVWAAIPDSARASLRQSHMQNTACALALYHRLSKVLAAFSQRGLAVIVLKGAFLGEIVYRDRSERSMGDVDLLVSKASIEPGIEVLRSAGYHSALDHQAQEDFPFHHHAPPFVQAGFPTVELHWTITPPAAQAEIDLDGVWQRAQSVVIAGATVSGLAPEDLHACEELGVFTVMAKPFDRRVLLENVHAALTAARSRP